jgi:hypothetical protein
MQRYSASDVVSPRRRMVALAPPTPHLCSQLAATHPLGALRGGGCLIQKPEPKPLIRPSGDAKSVRRDAEKVSAADSVRLRRSRNERY